MSELALSGFVEVERALTALPLAVAGPVLVAALRKAGTPMSTDAQRGAPRSAHPGPHGHMADSIKLRLLRETSGSYDLEANLWLGPDALHFYSIFPEFGTIHQGATPFMRPAWDRHKDEAVTILGRELWAGVERAAKRLAQ